jgi:predicted ABC-type transport system involved in lysophospholipase L1 biosynthesis ATPase subunit
MNLTREYIRRVADAARAYDNAKDANERVALGARLDALTDCLSDGQTRQVASILTKGRIQ